MDAAFAALGDPVRRRILTLLASGEHSVGELVAAVTVDARLSQPAISQHLRVLREAGLVSVHAEGRRRVYALDPATLTAAASWLTALTDPTAPFAQPLDALATEVARGRRSWRGTDKAAPVETGEKRRNRAG